MRRGIIGALVLALVGVGAGFAFFALRGGDAPPPPELSEPQAATPEATTEPGDGPQQWEVVRGDSFVGYRVREEFITIGVTDAVGRTGDVTGTVEVEDDTVRNAELEADLTTLRSDERGATTRCGTAGSRPRGSRRRRSSWVTRPPCWAATRPPTAG